MYKDGDEGLAKDYKKGIEHFKETFGMDQCCSAKRIGLI
jgi:hypothetical protein